MSSEIENLVKVIANATKNAFIDLFRNNEKFYYCALVTTEEALPPFISAWSREALKRTAKNKSLEFADDVKWSYADSPFKYRTRFEVKQKRKYNKLA